MFFRKNTRVKAKIYSQGPDGFKAYATDGKLYIWNCYGSTEEAAKEMALFKLRKEHEKEASNKGLDTAKE